MFTLQLVYVVLKAEPVRLYMYNLLTSVLALLPTGL
jgi:hypothetical protein